MRKMRDRIHRKSATLLKRSPGIILSVALLSLVIYLLGWSSLLSLKKIDISGTTQSVIIQRSLEAAHPHIKLGEPLARIDVHAVNRAIARNEWVESVVIGRSWIHSSLSIKVQERTPVAAFIDGDGVQNYFDAHGNNFRSPLQYSKIPQINLVNDTPAAKVAVSQLLSTLPSELLATAHSFTVKSERDLEMEVSITAKRMITISWGSPTDIGLKFAVYQRLLTLKENATATLFDLSDPLSPITK